MQTLNRNLLLTAAILLLCSTLALSSCSKQETSSLESTSTTQNKESATPTSYSEADPVPSSDMTEIWTRMGFTKKQAECLSDKMKDLSQEIDQTDPAGDLAKNQGLIQGLLEDCDIDEATMNSLGGS
ncbi:MAG: hypothetical protein WD029_01905 [Microthrixaceae bacterium]